MPIDTEAVSLDRIRQSFSAMPGLLKIVTAAAMVLGLLQLLAIVFPPVSPSLSGIVLTNVLLQTLCGVGHLILGWGVYARKSWARPLLIVFPLFQYSIFYAALGLPPTEVDRIHLLYSALWAAFFAVYCYRGGGRSYFESQPDRLAA